MTTYTFNAMTDANITDASSGVIYGIAPDAFSDPGVANVKEGVTYYFNSTLLTGTFSQMYINTGIIITHN